MAYTAFVAILVYLLLQSIMEAQPQKRWVVPAAELVVQILSLHTRCRKCLRSCTCMHRLNAVVWPAAVWHRVLPCFSSARSCARQLMSIATRTAWGVQKRPDGGVCEQLHSDSHIVGCSILACPKACAIQQFLSFSSELHWGSLTCAGRHDGGVAPEAAQQHQPR